jgi:hypothetical protein
MTDRIYVTYTPTTAPGTYHTTIHYERTDSTGNVVKHVIIEGQPENLDELGASDKATGVVEETFRKDDGPSHFGRIATGLIFWQASAPGIRPSGPSKLPTVSPDDWAGY